MSPTPEPETIEPCEAAVAPPSAEEVVARLGLVPMPREGGLFRSTWRNEAGSAIYYFLRDGDRSALHRLRGTEIWHHYAGDPVEMLLLLPDGSVERPILGDDLRAGQRPMVVVEGGVWMAAVSAGPWTLLGATMAPPFIEDDFEIGDATVLSAAYPGAADDIVRLAMVAS